jgi:hypothetical protein
MTIKVSLIILLALLSILVMPITLAQSDEDAYMILVTFSEPMSKDGIFDINNYEVLANDNVPVKIYKVGVVENNTAVVLYIEKNSEWKNFTIKVSNLKDLAGNLLNYNKNFVAVDLQANIELGQK